MTAALEAVTRRVTELHGLDETLARAVVAEVVDAFDATIDAFVARRHAELRRAGLGNEAIYERLGSELESWRFRAPQLTPRQLRRRIYG